MWSLETIQYYLELEQVSFEKWAHRKSAEAGVGSVGGCIGQDRVYEVVWDIPYKVGIDCRDLVKADHII